MNQSIACIFPETVPDPLVVSAAAQLFDQIVLIRTADDEPEQDSSPSLTALRQAGRLQSCVPAPLGGNSERFQLLLHDLTSRGAEEIARLGALALSGLRQREERESSASQLTHLLRQGADGPGNETDLLLWQSSLILKLAEWSDRQEAEVRASLDRITRRHQALFAALRDEEVPLEAHRPKADTEQKRLLGHRLRAWTRLCLHGGAWPRGLAVTRRQSLCDQLADTFTERHGRRPHTLLRLWVPSRAMTANTPDTGVGDGPALLRPAMLAAGQAQADSGLLASLCDTVARQWPHRAVDSEHRQPANNGGIWFALLYFPGITLQGLLAEGCGEQVPAAATAAGCCIGLLEGDPP